MVTINTKARKTEIIPFIGYFRGWRTKFRMMEAPFPAVRSASGNRHLGAGSSGSERVYQQFSDAGTSLSSRSGRPLDTANPPV
jgi:hypothetical protein